MPGPFEAWLLQRGMRTLFLRVHRASQSALEIATISAGIPRWPRCSTPACRPSGA